MRPRELSATLELFPARTPTLAPATHTNSYAIGGRDVILVEPATPYDDEQRAWLDWARALPSTGRRVVAIALTHHHVDHVGGAETFARELDVPLWAHEATITRLDEPTRARVVRRLVDGETVVLEGPRDERWRVLHTPGHAPGHVCFFEERSKTAIVGDMVASVGTILVAPGDGDMVLYLQQLDRLAGLGASLALPAHGEPIDDPTALFRRYITHRTMRETKIWEAVRAAGPSGADAAALVPVAYDDTPPHVWPIALLSLQAHLDKLEHDGRVARSSEPTGGTDAPVYRAVLGS